MFWGVLEDVTGGTRLDGLKEVVGVLVGGDYQYAYGPCSLL